MSIKLKDFIKENLGKCIDYDGKHGSQCVDLFRQYNKDVLGNDDLESVEGAKDLFLNYDNMPKHKKAFKKLSSGDLKKGDLAILDKSEKNPYGHVAIVIGRDGDTITVIEQDGLNQNKGTYKNKYKITKILGGLRSKKSFDNEKDDNDLSSFDNIKNTLLNNVMSGFFMGI